jgi:hypothetical protein
MLDLTRRWHDPEHDDRGLFGFVGNYFSAIIRKVGRVQRRTSNAERRTPNTEHRTPERELDRHG